MTDGTSTSLGLQFAVRFGPEPVKYSTTKTLRQLPLSSSSLPFRKVTCFAVGYGTLYDGNDCGGVRLSAVSVYARQISAGKVPPATGRPWNSVSIGRSRFG